MAVKIMANHFILVFTVRDESVFFLKNHFLKIFKANESETLMDT